MREYGHGLRVQHLLRVVQTEDHAYRSGDRCASLPLNQAIKERAPKTRTSRPCLTLVLWDMIRCVLSCRHIEITPPNALTYRFEQHTLQTLQTCTQTAKDQSFFCTRPLAPYHLARRALSLFCASTAEAALWLDRTVLIGSDNGNRRACMP